MNVFSVRRLSFGVALLLALLGVTPATYAVSANVVISQVYGGGGNAGATYTHDYVELFNRGTTTVSLAGWSIQYASATGTGNFGSTTTQITPLSGSIAPGQYLLVQEATNAAVGSPLPTPDVTDATPIAMAAGAGKVALVNTTTPLGCNGSSGQPCSPAALAAIVDLVGYGTANFFEGSAAAPTLSAILAAFRAGGGCTDSDNNSADFTAATPSPRNTASTFNVCSGPGLPTNPSGVGAATPGSVDPGGSSLLTVTVTPGANPTSTGLSVAGDLSAIGGSATQAFFNDGTNGDVTSGDNVFSYLATVALATTPGGKTLPATITDAQARSGSASISLSVRALVEIYQIQGTGLASPLLGQAIRSNDNIVTGVGSDGFFIQTPDGRADADIETSNGIFVFTGSAPTVQIGDQVDVTGTVAEFFNLTEINGPGVTVDSPGNALPAAITLDSTTPSPNQPQPANEMERFEGMLVQVENALVTGPTDRFGDFSVAASSSRTFREPGILYPGLPGLPVWDGNPEVFEINPDQLGLPEANVPAGAIIDLAVGPLSFDFGDYQIWPTTLTWTGEAEVVPVRDRNAGEFTVATQNVLRLFDTVNDPGSDEVPTAQEYADRLTKFSLLIRGALKAPDVLVVQEAEKLTVLQDLAAKIATDDPAITYTPYLIEGNDIGGIDIGFLVRDRVQVDSVTQFGASDTFTFNAVTAILNDRPPLVLKGSYVAFPGAIPFPITVIGVHQRSLGGIEDPTDGPRVREKRHQQALRLSQYIQSLQASDPDVRLVVLGDFNAFEFSDGYVDVMGQVTGNLDPAGALVPATDEVDPDLTNQTLNLPAEERYSFVFEGNAQSLDHVLTSEDLDTWTRGAEHARGNADAPASFDDDASTALRSSDHDGTVLFIVGGDSDGDGNADDTDVCIASNLATTVVIDGCNSGAGNDLQSDGCTISDRISACAAAAVTHEGFTACVTQYANELVRAGVITNKEKGAIQKCAGQADIP